MVGSIFHKVSSALWFVWGVFHCVIGVYLLYLMKNGKFVDAVLGIAPGVESLSASSAHQNRIALQELATAFSVTQVLKQHAWNLLWFGAVTAVGSVFVWSGSKSSVFLCALVGGFADFGYFMFIDVAGLAGFPGPQMTYIAAAGIAAGFYAVYNEKNLKGNKVQ